MGQRRNLRNKGQLFGPLLPRTGRKRGRQRRSAGAVARRDLAHGLSPHRRILRSRNRTAARRRNQDSGQGRRQLPRTLRIFAPDHRHRPHLHAGRHGTAAANDHRPASERGRLGHEPRSADARRGAARGGRIERQRRRLSGFPQGADQKPLPFRGDAVRRLHAGRGGRRVDRHGVMRRRRADGRIRRRGPHPRRPATSTVSTPTGSAPTWRSSRCRS